VWSVMCYESCHTCFYFSSSNDANIWDKFTWIRMHRTVIDNILLWFFFFNFTGQYILKLILMVNIILSEYFVFTTIFWRFIICVHNFQNYLLVSDNYDFFYPKYALSHTHTHTYTYTCVGAHNIIIALEIVRMVFRLLRLRQQW
jgi:hypothetical protein